uniref:DNA polymerase III delta N-terminal domain-containing protein n=1 Tax=candidate division WOR-3 bacterium TaxID=2052148 RepID=A0A7C4X939_UNCW3
MDLRGLKNQIKNGEIFRHYLLVSNEPLLFAEAINSIKSAVGVNESFDYEVCSITELSAAEITNRLYTLPFVSSKRIVVIKNLEEKEKGELKDLARMVRDIPQTACLIMTYRMEKELGFKKMNEEYEKIRATFSFAHSFLLLIDREHLQNLVLQALGQKNSNIARGLLNYLVNEFGADLTGLKNELVKLSNYLYEAKSISYEFAGEFIRGLSGYNKYELAQRFIEGRRETLWQFEKMRPYFQSLAEVVDALVRVINNYLQKGGVKTIKIGLLDELSSIDHSIKVGSNFADVLMEIFFTKHSGILKKR